MTDEQKETALVVSEPAVPSDIIVVDVKRIGMGEPVTIQTYDNRHVTLAISDVKLLVKGGDKCSDLELAAYLSHCMGAGYDPMRNQCYLIKYNDRDPAEWVVSYHVYLDRANRHPQFDGFTMGIVWRVDGAKVKGQPCDYDVDATHKIIGAWAEVERKDRSRIFYREVPLSEMQKTKRDGTPTKTWNTMPTTMAVKVPLCRALRDAFPDELGNTYADVERIGPPDVSPIAAKVLPREERPADVDLSPDDPGPDIESPTSLLAARVTAQIQEQRPDVEVTREMIVPIMLTLASSASDGQPESDFANPEAWTDDLVASINHMLDTSGPFPEDWLPGEPTVAQGDNNE